MAKKERSVNELTPAEPVKKTRRQEYFEKQRIQWSDRDIQLEILYAQQIQIDKLEKIRANTNTMIWWLIAIPIILAILLVLLGGAAAL